MYRSLTYLARHEVEKLFTTLGSDRVLVSITSPQDEYNDKDWCRPVKLGPNVFRDVLRLEFHDQDNKHIYHPKTKMVLISEDQGYQILEFLKRHEGQDLDLYVHCEGGISRSAAVAKFASDFYHLPIWKVQEGILYKNPVVDRWNGKVYAMLVKLYGLCLAGKGRIPADRLPAAPAAPNKETTHAQED